MQLFNWFKENIIGTVLSGWQLSSQVGYAVQFLVGGFWSSFPNKPV
jgi:hypothetical protein